MNNLRGIPFLNIWLPLFGIHLDELILHQTDNLSKTFRSTSISAAEYARAAEMTVATLQLLRNEDSFDIWATVLQRQAIFYVNQPELNLQESGATADSLNPW